MPAVAKRLRDFHGYLRSIQDDLAAGRGLRGRRAQHTRAAIGHALAFPTWRSLTRDEGLSNEEAAELMAGFVAAAETAKAPFPGPSKVAGAGFEPATSGL